MASPKPLNGKIALVTGGSKGIGAAVCAELSSLGAKVAINYSSDSAAADAVVAKLGGSENAIAIKANAADVKDIERMVQETVDKWGKIDILMPNAGVMMMRDLEHTSEEDWDRMFAVNVKGPYFLCQKAVPHMASGSKIILVSTGITAASTVMPPYLLYASSKGAIEQMTRVMAKDLGRKGILVNAVAPGPTGTDLFYEGKSEELVKSIANWNPFGRVGTPEEIAEVVGWLAGDKSRWVTGKVVRVDGGMVV